MGLLLSASVYSTAWATEIPKEWNPEIVYETIDGVFYDKLIISPDKTVTNTADYTYQGKKISDFDTIEVFFDAKQDGQRPIGVYSERFDWDNTNLIVHVTGNYSNNDALHFSNFDPYIHLNNLTIDMQAKGSDAINLSRDIRGDADVHLATNVTAIVKDGNGIRANASKWDDGKVYSSKITIDGNTLIQLDADACNRLEANNTGSSVNPTAVWAGSECNYVTDNQKAYGKGEIYLKGDTTIQLNGAGKKSGGFLDSILKAGKVYGISAGKNGYIEVNNLKITAEQEYTYGVSASEVNLSYNGVDNTENKQGTKVVLNGDWNQITMKGDNSKAIYAEGVDANGNSNSVQSGEKGIDSIEITGDISAENGGLIDLHVLGNKLSSTFDGNITAHGTGGNISTYSAQNNSKASTVNLVVDNVLTGHGTVAAANGGTVNLILGEGSEWAGRADDYQDADSSAWNSHSGTFENVFGVDRDGKNLDITGSGKVNLTLNDSARWVVTGQSWLSSLVGENGIVSLRGSEDGTEAPGQALHIGKVIGTNTFIMNIKADGSGDMLYVKDGSEAGIQNLYINNGYELLKEMNVGEKIRFATVTTTADEESGFGTGNINGTVGSDKLFAKTTTIRDVGMFNVDFNVEYHDYNTIVEGDTVKGELETVNDTYNGGTFGENKPGSTYVEENYVADSANGQNLVNEEKFDRQNAYLVRQNNTLNNISDAGKTIINMSRANYKNAIYMDRLNKRLGEARYINGEDEQGMWVRLRHDRIGQSGDFRSMNTMYELGYDVKQDCDNGERRIGMAVDYMRGSTSYSDIAG